MERPRGGKDNYPVDRESVREILRLYPETRPIALANRAFLQRAVRFLAAEVGIRQFLDIGTGIPAAGNVHEVAGQAAPDAWVVYVDNDHCKSGCAHAGGITFPPFAWCRAVVPSPRPFVPVPRVTCRHARGRDEGTIPLPRLRRVIVRPSAYVCPIRLGARGADERTKHHGM